MSADTDTQLSTGADASLATDVSRRGFLRGAVIAGGGLMAASLAACTPSSKLPAWTYAPGATPVPGKTAAPGSAAPATAGPATAAPSAAAPTPAASSGGGSIPAGWTSHDIDARNVVRRYLGNLAPAFKGVYGDAAFAKIADMLAVSENYPELAKKPSFAQVPNLFLTDVTAPVKPTVENGVKVFRLTIDTMDQLIDELKPPIAALGFNKQWPGPTLRVNLGDKVRAEFLNNLRETTGVHFHGIEFEDFFMDGVPFVTQKPIAPGETGVYEFTANRSGSLMYHSHHNATDQVGRGLLGAFIVEDPKTEPKVDREVIWISNDALGGFTINGHGFPATVPVLAASGETVRIRFMNEGVMMHPWHLHGYRMRVVARDGYPLGSAEFDCDTLGVNPGERYDVLVKVDRPGLWAFHCHVLPHAEGSAGMFGMVNTLVVVPKKEHVDAIVGLLLA
ncbi:MAG TPA: multicopper oxidase family protein [Candidatus Limnocylindrales bacterium]|nr:multicopper oxidase family protein [Candidatus Limnocylindrales bacterium]